MKYNFKVILQLAIVLAASFAISSFKLDYFESLTYDIRVRVVSWLGLRNVENSPVVLVLINSKTTEKYKGFPSYIDHAEFLEKIYHYQPAFVFYDFRKGEKGELLNLPGQEIEKLAFVSSAQRFENFFIGSDELTMKNEDKIRLAPPLDVLKYESAPKSPDGSILAKDGVYRRLMLSYQEQVLLHAQVASHYNPDVKDLKNVRGIFDFYDTQQVYINYHPKGSFATYSFEDVMDGQVSADQFKGKIVIVGTDSGISSKEYAMTPFSREVTAMTSAELHANSFQTLIENKSPIIAPKLINQLLTLLISLLTLYVVIAMKPSKGLLILAATVASICAAGTLLLATFNLWIYLAHPFLAIFLCYYFFIPYRLIIENRRSWEYIQKNKLLQQVEELKTNFISMMSHDLKTPIARIQGMTEVILKDEVTLSSTQREAVDTIRSSSNDLLKFINSILQYGRIESQGVELHRQSKDINQLLQDVIKKHEFLAKVKRIRIRTELEPLFPVPVDPDLIKQVLSNLVENAIKYSPEDSEVEVRSREDGDTVVVEVKDQGMGIPAEDLPNIFMKFYRSQNVKTSTIKGTGLGLYLAQYFAQLHKGKITVTSEPGQGTIFKVTLPINF